MAQTIGWWDYEDADRPTLANRESGERVRFGGEVRIPGKRLGQLWIRLDYQHDDLEFPVVVCWMPEQGHIVVDYLASVAIWRQETNSNLLYPTYGAWLRVDDCILDAIWCWPGILERLQQDPLKRSKQRLGVVGLIGGWCNGSWQPEFRRISVVRGRRQEQFLKFEQDESEVHLPLRSLTPLDEPAPSPWVFVDPTAPNDHQGSDYSVWNGFELAPEEDLSNFEIERPHHLPPRSAGVGINGLVPQMRATDGSRIFFPVSATIKTYRNTDSPRSGGFEFACIAKNKMGILGGCLMGPFFDSIIEKDLNEIKYSFVSVNPYINRKRSKRKAHGKSGYLPNIAFRDEYEILDHVEVATPKSNTKLDYLQAGPWILSAMARRRTNRLLQDAFLFWEGTPRRPDSWSSVTPDVLSYQHHDTVRSEPYLLGGWRLGFEISARLSRKPGRWFESSAEHPWTPDGFKFNPFL